jgi:hypothetical protein
MQDVDEIFAGVTVVAIDDSGNAPTRPGIVVECHLDGALSVHYGDQVVRGPAELWRRVRGPLGRVAASELLARIPWKAAT